MTDRPYNTDLNDVSGHLPQHPAPPSANDLSPAINAALESVDEHDTSDRPIETLHPVVAQRFVMLDAHTANHAQQAVDEHGSNWYFGSGLFDDRGSVQTPRGIGRARASSGPAVKAQTGYAVSEGEGDALVVKECRSAQGAGSGEHLQTWKADIGTVSSVFDSMLAEDDHGRI